MADATLQDVTKALKDANASQMKEQKSTTAAVNTLTRLMKEFLSDAEYARMQARESNLEAKRAASAAQAKSNSTYGGGGGDASGFGGMLLALPGASLLAAATAALVGFTGGLAGFVAATEGLGPNSKDMKLFTGAVSKYGTFLKSIGAAFALPEWAKPGKKVLSAFDTTPGNIRAVEKLIGDRFKYDPKSARWQKLTGPKGYSSFDNVAKNIKLAQADMKKLSFMDKYTPSAALKAATIKGGWLSGLKSGLTNNAFVRGLLKVLRPLAVVLSLFTGFKTAQKEMEEQEGIFSKLIGGGVGGFFGGFIGSFFGELLDLIKAMPLYIIKQFVPAEWLTTDKRGKVVFREDKGAILKGLATIDRFSFAELLKEIVMFPFEVLGSSLDFVRNLFGAEGTTEEGQTQAKAAWEKFKRTGSIGDQTVFGVIADIVFSPINALINEAKAAFLGEGYDREADKKTFTQNLKSLAQMVYDLIPDAEDVKRNIASGLSPAVAKAIGLGSYIPQDPQEYLNNMMGLQDKISARNKNELYAVQAELLRRELGEDPIFKSDFIAANSMPSVLNYLKNQDEENRRILEEMYRLSNAAKDGGVNPTVITSHMNQIETMMFPNGGVMDANDGLRLDGPSI